VEFLDLLQQSLILPFLSKQQFNQAVFTVYAPLRNQSTSSDIMFVFLISKEEFVEEFCREDEKKFL